VTVDADGVLVEVSDHSPHLPVQRSFTTESTTGRGLELLSLLATRHGARLTQDGGKIVWFTLGRHRGPESRTVRATPTAMVTIELRRLNVALFRTFLDHAASLLREHLITCLADDGIAGDDREELRQEADEAAAGNDALTLLTEATAGQLNRATGTHVDAVFAIPAAAVGAFAALDQALDRAVVQAARGELLAPPSQPELRRLRSWCLAQVLDQARGETAEPWQSRDATSWPTERARPDWDDSAVTGSDRALVAADDANRILAVSGPAAELLGWAPADLVGRRLVSIIPARHHEAHIAGFVRFLLSGERRIVGRDVRVPALRRDGSEVPVVMRIEPERLSRGRTVLVAELQPAATHEGDACAPEALSRWNPPQPGP
jgi:PAS domain S-box-containing protein